MEVENVKKKKYNGRMMETLSPSFLRGLLSNSVSVIRAGKIKIKQHVKALLILPVEHLFFTSLT